MSRNARAKWALVSLIGVVDGIWMILAGFHPDQGLVKSSAAAGALIAVSLFYFYADRDRRILDFAHFGALVVAMTVVTASLSYLAVSTDAPLADRHFDAIDKALGFNWLVWMRWVRAHHAVTIVLELAYASLPVQAVVIVLYHTHARATARLSELWWSVTLASLATVVISAVVPAISAWVYYGALSMGDLANMRQFAALRAGTMHVVTLSDSPGLIQLPSFHTILAILFTYTLRRRRFVFPASVLLNLLLIAACPTEGGHYFVDIPAGMIVAAAAIYGARVLERRLDAPEPSSRKGSRGMAESG
jgi:hypothetical protein